MADTRTMQILSALSAGGSLTAAGKAVGMSQQAVSARLSALEAETGQQLMVRRRAGMELTSFGKLLLHWAEPSLAAISSWQQLVELTSVEPGRDFGVGVDTTIATYKLPGWLDKLAGNERMLLAQVALTVDNSAEICRQIVAGELELGFVETPEIPSQLNSAVFAAEPLALVVTPDHPWAQAGSVRPTTLSRTPLLQREAGSGTRSALTWLLAGQGCAPCPVYGGREHQPTDILNLVAAGVAPAVVPTVAAMPLLAAGAVVSVPVTGMKLYRPLLAVWAGARPSLRGAMFLQAVQQVASS